MTENLNLATMSSQQGFTVVVNDYNGGGTAANVGDTNGDGLSDFVITTSSSTSGTLSYLIYGFKGTIPSSLSELGSKGVLGVYTVISSTFSPISKASGAGDVNGDGYADIIIGGGSYDFVVYGSQTLNSTTAYTISNSSGQIGCTIITGGKSSLDTSTAGDVNNDNYQDVVIGYGNVVNIIFGSSNMPSTINVGLSSSFLVSIVGDNPPYIGATVNAAGDVNGDGFDDVIFSTNTNNVLFYGSNNLESSYSISNSGLSGVYTVINVNGDNAQQLQVSGCGDMNKDGFSEFMIANPNVNNDYGATYVFFGNSSISQLATLSYPSGSSGFTIDGIFAIYPGHNPKIYISGAGDVNKDGFDDIIIGLNNYPSNSYVVYGNKTLSSITLDNFNGFTLNNTNHRESSVSGGGDFNGDGFFDLIIGTFGTSTGVSASNYLVYGATNGFNTASPSAAPTFSPTCHPTQVPSKTPTLHPTQNPTNSPTLAPSVASNTHLPTIITTTQPSLHNTPSPSISHSFVPTTVYTSVSSKAPALYPTLQPSYHPQTVIYLNDLSSSQGISISGVTYDDSYPESSKTGYSVSSAGDVNNDGIDDIVIGAPSYSSVSATGTGKVYIVYGNKNLNNINLESLTSEQGISITGNISDGIGYSVSSAGDINNDGYADIIIGAPFVGIDAGVCYIIFGGPSLSNINLNSFTQSQGIYITGSNYYYLGVSVSGAGDINNDGIDDVIIGAPQCMPETSGSICGVVNGATSGLGMAYVIYGSANINNINLGSLSTSQGIVIYGPSYNSYTGYSVSGAGDVNGDKIDDIIIGAPAANYNTYGFSYVIYGKTNISNIDLSSLSNSEGFFVEGDISNEYIGFSVSGAGDVNGDKYHDVIVGSALTGSYVLYGGASLSSINNLNTLTKSQGLVIYNSDSSWSVSSAGDLNNDGFDDVVVGSPSVNDAYVVYGSSSLPLQINVGTNGESIYGLSSSGTGYSVSAAGDINGDGNSDIIIGAPYINNYAGEVYLIYGTDAANNDDSNSGSSANKLQESNVGIIAGAAIGGVALMGVIGYGLYAYSHNFCSFTESLASKAADLGSQVGDSAL